MDWPNGFPKIGKWIGQDWFWPKLVKSGWPKTGPKSVLSALDSRRLEVVADGLTLRELNSP